MIESSSRRVSSREPVVVGIAGGSASGKSTVVSELVRLLGPGASCTLRHDAYYHDLSHLPFERRIEVNVDHPESLETELLVEHVGVLLSGRPVELPAYDFASQTRGPVGSVVEPAPVLIVEGLFTLWDQRLRDLMHLKVFIQTTEEERLERRIRRDREERGRNRTEVLEWHNERVQPMHDLFVEPSREHADVVISEGAHNHKALHALAQRVSEMAGS